MKKLYSLATAALLAMSSLSVSAQIDVTVSIDPANGSTFEAFPDEFTLTFDGTVDGAQVENLKKTFSNLVTVKVPGATNVTALSTGTYVTFEGNKAKVKTNKANGDPAFAKDVKGEYEINILKGGVYFMDADNLNLKSDGKNASNPEALKFTYTINGNEQGGGDDDDDSVKFDIELTGTTPQLLRGEFDASMRTLETLQLVFNAPQLKLKENAAVTITGPSYNYTVALKTNMSPLTSTNFKANFPSDPVYNGEYTLTIPEGVIGDEAYMADNTKGHANAAVNVKFTVIGGEEYVEGQLETTFNPLATPAQGKVGSLDDVTLTFDSEVFYAADTELKVGFKSDYSAVSYTNYGVATIERVSPTVLKLVFNPAPSDEAEYQVSVPEGTFWDATHNADEKTGKINSEQAFVWRYAPQGIAVKVESTFPVNDTHLGSIPAGFKFIVNTDNNAAVGSLKVTIEELNIESETARPKNIVTDSVSTAKTEDGAPCWVNDGDAIALKDGYLYTAFITVLDINGVKSTTCEIEFYGDSAVGVMSVEIDAENAVIYNLNGVRVKDATNLPAGLYIRNGKKVVIK